MWPNLSEYIHNDWREFDGCSWCVRWLFLYACDYLNTISIFNLLAQIQFGNIAGSYWCCIWNVELIFIPVQNATKKKKKIRITQIEYNFLPTSILDIEYFMSDIIVFIVYWLICFVWLVFRLMVEYLIIASGRRESPPNTVVWKLYTRIWAENISAICWSNGFCFCIFCFCIFCSRYN